MKFTKDNIIRVILFLLFIYFAIVQLNDPDPIHWFTIYALIAVLFLVSIFKPIPKISIYILSLALLIYAGYHFLYFIDFLQIDNKQELFGEMVYEKPYLEGTREFLGLIIAAAALLFLLKKAK